MLDFGRPDSGPGIDYVEELDAFQSHAMRYGSALLLNGMLELQGKPGLPLPPKRYKTDVIPLPPPPPAKEPAELQDPIGRAYYPREIVRKVAGHFYISEDEMNGQERHSILIDARATAAKVLRDALGLSTPQIGRYIGGRDHTGILNLLSKFDIYQKRNAAVAPIYKAVMAEYRREVQQ